MLDRDEIVKYGRFLDTPNKRGSGYKFYSSYGSDRYHGHNCYHIYRRSERGYFPNEFNKVKPPTFNGELKNMDNANSWFLGMKKFFDLHDYTENMKARIAILSLKWKANIWWEDAKCVIDIRTNELS